MKIGLLTPGSTVIKGAYRECFYRFTIMYAHIYSSGHFQRSMVKVNYVVLMCKSAMSAI